jgi:hypothetical protein
MKTHYPSRQEVALVQRERMEALNRERVFAEYQDPNTPVIRYRQVVREKGYTAQSADDLGGFKLLREHQQVMRDLRDFKTDGTRARCERLGYSPEKFLRILRELKETGCIFVRRVRTDNPKGGNARSIASLSERGHRLLETLKNSNS